MMLRPYKTLACSFLAILGLAACGGESRTTLGTDTVASRVDEARARNDGPPIWVMRDADSTLYFYGTVHLLPTDLSWQREDMRNAFNEAGTVFFEVDTGPDGQIEATVLTTELGLRDDGRRLTYELDNYQRNLMEAAATNGNLTIASLDSMRPWLASEFLTFSAAQNAGLSAELSADEALKSRAQRSGKNILYFETMKDQITASADLPDFVQLNLLTETLESFNDLGDDLNAVARQWSVGGTQYLTDELVTPMKARAPEVYNALLRDRNRKWAPQLTRFMEDSGTGFVAVGVSHLLGKDSLLAELREQGYTIERYYAFKGENVIETVDTTIIRQ